jgi:hypothetical protein
MKRKELAVGLLILGSVILCLSPLVGAVLVGIIFVARLMGHVDEEGVGALKLLGKWIALFVLAVFLLFGSYFAYLSCTVYSPENQKRVGIRAAQQDEQNYKEWYKKMTSGFDLADPNANAYWKK